LSDHLALFGQLETSVERPRREAQDRPVGRPAAAPDRPTAAVEKGELDAMSPGGRDERGLGPVDQPVPGEIAGLLVRIGVAEHHLLAITPAADMIAIRPLGEDRVENITSGLERGCVLE